VTLIASDGTNGNSYNSIRARFHVRSITADILADRESGPAPLVVRFSPLEARDKKGGPLNYRWDFGDGQGSAEPSPAHTFDRAGFFEVALTVSGPSGEFTARRVVQARPTWPLLLDNGWRSNGIDPRLWRVQTPGPPVQVKRGVLDLYEKGSDQGVSLTSVPDFTPPFYLEAVYTSSPGRKASGFRVLGLHIGLLEDRQARDRVVLAPADLKEREKKPAQEIAALKSSSPCRWLLKLLVDQDPAHPGRIRFQGKLTTETGAHFFRLDNQPISGRKLEIMTDSRSAAFEVARFQVWARPENAPGLEAEAVPAPSPGPGPAEPDVCAGTPDQEYFRSVTRNRKASARLVALEGNGLAISDGDQEPDPMRHTDFGAAPVRGALARTFTLYNLGPKSLELGGPPPYLKIMGEGAAAFSVAKPPESAIGPYGATTFDLRFQPLSGGRYRAQVVLEYGKSGGRYRFQVQGEGK
jgi:hypothetical protein